MIQQKKFSFIKRKYIFILTFMLFSIKPTFGSTLNKKRKYKFEEIKKEKEKEQKNTIRNIIIFAGFATIVICLYFNNREIRALKKEKNDVAILEKRITALEKKISELETTQGCQQVEQYKSLNNKIQALIGQLNTFIKEKEMKEIREKTKIYREATTFKTEMRNEFATFKTKIGVIQNLKEIDIRQDLTQQKEQARLHMKKTESIETEVLKIKKDLDAINSVEGNSIQTLRACQNESSNKNKTKYAPLKVTGWFG